MITTIKRAPNDDFTFNLFTKLLESVDCDFEAHYIWSNPPKRLKRILETTEFTKPNIVIGIKDLLDQWVVFNPWTDRAQAGTKLIDEMASRNPDKNFIIFTSLENLEHEEITSKNIQFVHWGGDITNQAELYPSLKPVLDKNFESEATYISLNRNAREHRVVTLSYLFGREYDSAGHITFLGNKFVNNVSPSLLENLAWDFESIQADIFVDHREIIKNGYSTFCGTEGLNYQEDYDIYEDQNDNIANFNQNLRSKYRHSFVELVSESSFASPGFNITEKTLNSIYACNFPIVFGGVGIVNTLRAIGFDMFDDVVNHSYDDIINPFNRIINAIECNRKLLLDADYAKEQWRNNQDRFVKNVELARTQLYPWYHARATAQFDQLNWIG